MLNETSKKVSALAGVASVFYPRFGSADSLINHAFPLNDASSTDIKIQVQQGYQSAEFQKKAVDASIAANNAQMQAFLKAGQAQVAQKEALAQLQEAQTAGQRAQMHAQLAHLAKIEADKASAQRQVRIQIQHTPQAPVQPATQVYAVPGQSQILVQSTSQQPSSPNLQMLRQILYAQPQASPAVHQFQVTNPCMTSPSTDVLVKGFVPGQCEAMCVMWSLTVLLPLDVNILLLLLFFVRIFWTLFFCSNRNSMLL